MYDALEFDLQNNGSNSSRFAEKTYFSKAFSLNSRDQLQVKALKEVVQFSRLPIG